MDWTIDTWVLYQVAQADAAALDLLEAIRLRTQGVGFDREGRIAAEYRRCLTVTRSREVARWFKAAVSKLAIVVGGTLPRRHEEALAGLRFHNDDWPLVAVASQTSDRRLVSEESDYTGEVRDYVRTELGISVLCVAESLPLAKGA